MKSLRVATHDFIKPSRITQALAWLKYSFHPFYCAYALIGWSVGAVLFSHVSLVGSWTIFYLAVLGMLQIYKLRRPAYFFKDRSPYPTQQEIVYISSEIASILAKLAEYDKNLFSKYSDAFHESVYFHINREAEMEEHYITSSKARSLNNLLFSSYMQRTMQSIVTEQIYTLQGYAPLTVTDLAQNYIIRFYPELILLNPVRFSSNILEQYAVGMAKVVDTLIALEYSEEGIRYEAAQWLSRKNDITSSVLLPADLMVGTTCCAEKAAEV